MRPRNRKVNATRAMCLLGLAAAGLIAVGACGERSAGGARVPGGADVRAVQLIRHYGCGTCHSIPGVPSATGLVGPALGGLKQRTYIGGVLTNTPENLTRWISNPRALAPRTAMPNLGVTEADAREIAAYLYTR